MHAISGGPRRADAAGAAPPSYA
eukprot:SAG22_NODE_20124_length_268_cov_0.822485_1_plen_22_part_01